MNFEISSGDEVIIRPSVWNAEYCILHISVYILDNRFLYTKYFILWNTTIVPDLSHTLPTKKPSGLNIPRTARKRQDWRLEAFPGTNLSFPSSL